MSQHAAIADALTAAINAASLSMAVTANRAPVPRFLLTEITQPRIDVVLGDRTSEILTRGGHRSRSYQVNVILQSPVAPGQTAPLDDLDGLADEIEQVILDNPAMATATLTAVETSQPYDPELIAVTQAYAWAITAIYKELSQ